MAKGKPVGRAPERLCHFGGYCKPKMIESRDPFTGETISDVICETCGKSFN